MLELDLARLEREQRIRVEASVHADDPLWNGTELTFREPLRLRAEARRAGADVLVELEYEGELTVACRRCLEDVAVEIADRATLLFRSGLDDAEAAVEDVYALPPRARELSLREPLREHVLLSAPRHVICREACRGLCPRCGANRNEVECECGVVEEDERWAPLRRLRSE
jgi:uncharacterized protein